MRGIQRIAGWGRKGLGPALGVALVAYFSFHTISGDRGLLAWVKLKQTLDVAQTELAEVSAERENLEHLVTLLSPETLDADLLEERARLVLNMGYEGDWVIPDPLALGN